MNSFKKIKTLRMKNASYEKFSEKDLIQLDTAIYSPRLTSFKCQKLNLLPQKSGLSVNDLEIKSWLSPECNSDGTF